MTPTRIDVPGSMTVAASFEAAGLWDRAAEVYDFVLAHEPAHLDALGRRTVLAYRQGGLEAASAVLRRAGADAPQAVGVQKLLAQSLLSMGEGDAAVAALRHALSAAPAKALFDLLEQILMPGPSYLQHLAWLHELLEPRTYLEIGVLTGAALKLARPPTRAIGVDPAPLCGGAAFAAETRIVAATSDAFFADPAASSDAVAIDFAFIDGLHLFEQVLRDFINVERRAAPHGVIALHDTLPLADAATRRTLAEPFASGDTWRIVPCLGRYRPDLRVVSIPAGPSGLTIVSGLDPASRVLEQRFDEAVATCGDLPYAGLEAELPALIARTANDRAATARAVADRRGR
jgi:hypothetical protein